MEQARFASSAFEEITVLQSNLYCGRNMLFLQIAEKN